MTVIYNRKTARSGRALQARLNAAGYHGRNIIWGRCGDKRNQLITMRDANVPIPELCFEWPDFACVGRPDKHSQGKWFYRTPADVQASAANRNHPPTHFLRWIEVQREFRVHVVDDKCIRLQEKLPPGPFTEGTSRWVYPTDELPGLRKYARRAVRALGWDLGAVDVLYDGTSFFVIEVNSAPALVREDENMEAATLNAYVAAFMRR
jgi:hypothetical protein